MSSSPSTLSAAAPAEAGLSAAVLDRAAGLLSETVAAGRVTAASLTVARRGRLVLSRGFGALRPEPGAPPVEADSTFLLASITKPVTACAVMLLVDRGLVSLDDPAKLHLPEFRGWDKARIRVRDLLSHISGLPDMLPQDTLLRRRHATLAEFVDGAVHARLLFRPRAGFRYQSMGILLAAEIVERVTGERLRDFERREIFEPLGMGRSCLGLGDYALEEAVWCGTSMELDADGRRFGPNTPYWRDFGHPWGGMHSAGPDLAVLLQCMLNGGEYGGVRILSRAAAAGMVRDHNPLRLESPWGLGWALRDSAAWAYFGELVSPGTFGHVGATGTVAWADPASGLICVCLTNQMVDGGALLRRVSNVVAASVQEE